MAVAAAGGRRRLVDLWATAPSAFNWQEPLGQAPIPPWSKWSSETKVKVLFFVCSMGLIFVCWAILYFFCRKNKDEDQDTSRFILGNDIEGEGVSSPPLHEMPAADMEMGQGGVDWMLANLQLLAPAADVDMEPAADEKIAPAQEPGPTLKCTYRTADGWAEGTCSVCLSELVDGEKVRVLTACMHCFHAACIEEWLRGNATPTCPLCRAPVMILPARRRRRRQSQA